MIASGRLAFANARTRALKSRLLGREILGRVAGATADGARVDRGFREFLEWHRIVSRSYPSGASLWQGLLRMHEIENVKLAWRAVVRRHGFRTWRHLWTPLGAAAGVEREALGDCTTLPALVGAMRETAYGSIAEAMLRSHPNDLAAAELGFDRWTSRLMVQAAHDLDAREGRARALALALVRERDLNVLRRGARAFGLTPDAVAGALACVPEEIPAAALARLASWEPGEGPLWMLLPRAWQPIAGRAPDWDALTLAWRRWRREECRRAFLDQPFCLAPGLALLLLKQEEVRGVRALSAAAGGAASPVLERTLAAGPLGA